MNKNASTTDVFNPDQGSKHGKYSVETADDEPKKDAAVDLVVKKIEQNGVLITILMYGLLAIFVSGVFATGLYFLITIILLIKKRSIKRSVGWIFYLRSTPE